MARWLTQEWLDDLVSRGRDLAEVAGASASLQYMVKGDGHGGATSYYWIISDGRLLEARLGELPGADVTLSMSYEDARRAHAGELDAAAAVMQGRIKTAGDMAKLIRLLPVITSPQFARLQEEVRGATDHGS